MNKEINNIKINEDSEVVLNSKFKRWTDHIEKNLRERSPSRDVCYKEGLDKELLEFCETHAKKYQTEKSGKKTVILTHPFYILFSNMHKIRTEDMKKEVEEYLEKLANFLKIKRDNAGVRVISLETIHHYAAATSLLLEGGLIDKTIFTLYDEGYTLNPEELEPYKNDEIFFGGGYNNYCLKISIKEMKKISSGEIWAIQELILNSPRKGIDTLKPKHVYGLPKSRVINLEEAVKRMGLISKVI